MSDMPDSASDIRRKPRIRYSRDEIMAFSDKHLSMSDFDLNNPVIHIPVPTRRKTLHSQSSDGDGQRTYGSSREDLAVHELDAIPNGALTASSRHRINRYPNLNNQRYPQSNYPSYHSKQRYPSGPTSDAVKADSLHINGPLRGPAEFKRGGYGDWSRGCAGWRQRSFSGSERSDSMAHSHYSNNRGRGNNHLLNEFGDSHVNRGRGRGRGRGFNRNQHSTATHPIDDFAPSIIVGHTHTSSSHIHHPVASMIGDTGAQSQLNVAEEFWQDEDWEDAEFPQKYLRSYPSNALFSDCYPQSINLKLSNMKIHSKSLSVETPPGFDIPQTKQSSDLSNEQTKLDICSGNSQNQPSVSASNTDVIDDVKPRDHQWYYIDLSNQIQGPFTNQQMAAWLADGYLPLSMQIRRDCDECFLSLADHMNLANRVPFLTGYSQPPINAQSVVSITHSSKLRTNNSFWASPTHMNNEQEQEQQQHDATLSQPSIQQHAISSVDVISTDPTTISPNTMEITPPTKPDLAVHQSINTFLQQASGNQLNLIDPIKSVLPSIPSLVPSTLLPNIQSDELSSTRFELLRLYNEAQTLAAHTAKVEAERLALVNKLAEINTTAVKLFSTYCPSLSQIDLPPDQPVDIVETTIDAQINSVQQTKQTSMTTTATLPNTSGTNYLTEVQPKSVDHIPVLNNSTTITELDNKLSPQNDNDSSVNAKCDTVSILPIEENDSSRSNLSNHPTPVVTTQSKMINTPELSGQKKVKRKNKKKKASAEQERQLAWEAEFTRRKAVALEQKLAEEAAVKTLAEEEAAALVLEESLALQEKTQVLIEQRKREALRIKTENEMSQLVLPNSARWASSSDKFPIITSLRSIQAAQAVEEAKKKKQQNLLTEEVVTMQTTNSTKLHSWSAMAQSTEHRTPASSSTINNAYTPGNQSTNNPSATTLSTANLTNNDIIPKSAKATARPKQQSVVNINHSYSAQSKQNGPKFDNSVTNQLPTAATTAHPLSNATAATSIWDLPISGASNSNNTSNKKKKKNARKSREAECFAAREQLAHWCESQLSSIPLTGIDLPTLIDLLCELQATEQITECIESSLGKSKRITKFSKDFLQKRACLLDVVP